MSRFLRSIKDRFLEKIIILSFRLSCKSVNFSRQLTYSSNETKTLFYLHLCPCSVKRWIRDYFAVSEIFLYVFLNSTSGDSSFTYLLFFPHSPPACYQQKKLACFKFGINQLIYLSAKALVSSWFLTCPHIYYIVNEMRSADIQLMLCCLYWRFLKLRNI